MCLCESSGQKNSIRFPGTRDTSGCELSDMDTWNQTHVLSVGGVCASNHSDISPSPHSLFN